MRLPLWNVFPEKNLRREITWNEFYQESNRMANALAKRGIKKGDRVVQLMMNSLEWLPIYFGILSTGAWGCSPELQV